MPFLLPEPTACARALRSVPLPSDTRNLVWAASCIHHHREFKTTSRDIVHSAAEGCASKPKTHNLGDLTNQFKIPLVLETLNLKADDETSALYYLILSSTLILQKKALDEALRPPRSLTPPAALTFWSFVSERLKDAVADVAMDHGPVRPPRIIYANADPLATAIRDGTMQFNFGYGWYTQE